MTETVQETLTPDVSSSVMNTTADSMHNSSPSPQEKMLPQSQVDKLIKTAKLAEAEKVRKEFMQSNNDSGIQAATQATQTQENSGFDQQKLQKLVQDELTKKAQEYQKQQEYHQHINFANNFAAKIEASKIKHPEIEKVFGDLNLANNPSLLRSLDTVDNLGDVLMDLHQNPDAFAKINLLAEKAPAMAHNALNKLSASIKANESAKQQAEQNKVPSPLSQVNASMANADTGKASFSDLQRKYRF